jgi:hypothetical protein
MPFIVPKFLNSAVHWSAFLVLMHSPVGHAQPFEKTCKLALIDKITVSDIAPSFTHNGQTQHIKKIESLEDKQSIKNAYVEKWRHTQQEPFNAMVDESSRWLIVSKVIGSCFHTLQLDKSTYKTSGYISTLRLETDKNAVVVNLGKNIPKMFGSSVLTDISHSDSLKKGRTTVIENKFSPDANAEFYIRTVGGDGWVTTTDHRVPGKRNNQDSRALTFNKNLETQIIVITKAPQGSHVVIQWMEKP